MSSMRAIVTINDDTISQLFLPGVHGDGWWWMRKVGNQHKQLAEIIAPKRTGEMAKAHKLFLTPNGRYQVRYTVGNTAYHALFVHEGTRARIYSSRLGKGGWNKWAVAAGKKRLASASIAKQSREAAFNGSFPMMLVRAAPHSNYATPTLRISVKGQAAQPWLVDAAEIIWQQYG